MFVQTRGTARATDYAFLGDAPAQPWWRAYRDATAFDHPTVLVTSDGERWAAYLSGIPSARVDAVGTVVRYTLVLDGACGAADTACVPAAVASWLDDVAAGRRLPAACRRPWMPGSRRTTCNAGSPRQRRRRHRRCRRRPTNGTLVGEVPRNGPSSGAAEVRRRALAALATLPPAGARRLTRRRRADDWIGAVTAPGPRGAFAARVAALVGGATGRALLLNLVGGPDDAGPLLDAASPVAVLVESTDPQLARPTALRPVVEAKKAPVPPARVAAATGWRRRRGSRCR